MQYIKNILKALGIILSIIIILEIASFFLPTNNLGFSLRKNLSDKYKIELDYDTITLTLLPTPHLIIKDLSIKYRNNLLIKAQNSEFFLHKASIIKIFTNVRLSFDDVAKVELNNGEINWDLLKGLFGVNSDSKLIAGLFLINFDFTINNSRIINEYGEKIANINAITFDMRDKTLNGQLDYRQIPHNIQLHIPRYQGDNKAKNDIKILLETPSFKLALDAKQLANLHKFLAGINQKNRKANFSLTVKNNQAFTENLLVYMQGNINDDPDSIPEKTATKPKTKSIKVAENNGYSLEANFDFDAEDFHLSNIQYSYGKISTPIQGFIKLNSSAEQNYLLAKIYAQSLNLSFLNHEATGVGLLKLIKFAQSFVTKNIAQIADDENSPDFDFIGKIPHRTTLSNVIVSLPEIIIDASRHSLFGSAMFYDDKIIIDDLSLNLDGTTSLKFYGNYRETKDLPGLAGILTLQSKKIQDIATFIGIKYTLPGDTTPPSLNLRGNFEINPNLINFRNGLIEINGKNTRFSTQIWSKSALEDQETPLSWDLNIQTELLDLDSWKAPVHIDNYLSKLYLADLEKKNETFYDYSNNFAWLRHFPTEFNINLTANSVLFRNNSLENALLRAYIAPNMLEIQRLDFDLDKSRIWSRGKFSLQLLEPHLEVTTQFAKLSWDSFSKILPNYNDIKAQAMAQQQDKPVAISSNLNNNIFFKKEPKKEEDKDEFNFFSLPYVNMKGQLIFNEADLFGFRASNGKFAFNANNGIVQANEIYCNTLDGMLSAQAYAEIYSAMPKFSLAFSLANVNPNKIFTYFTQSEDKIYGQSDFKGEITAYGNSWRSLMSRNSGSIDATGRRIVWNGFAINKAIDDIENGDISRETKQNTIENALNTGQTIFDELSGKITLTNSLASFNDFSFTNSRLAGNFAANYNIISRSYISIANFDFMPLNQEQALSIKLNSKGTLPNDVQNEFNKNVLERYLNTLYPMQDNVPSYEDIR